jgi:N-acetylmuramoyl-L-alanine amidase
MYLFAWGVISKEDFFPKYRLSLSVASALQGREHSQKQDKSVKKPVRVSPGHGGHDGAIRS